MSLGEMNNNGIVDASSLDLDLDFIPSNYFSRLKMVHTIKENNAISNVEYNTDGSLISYKTQDLLKVYFAQSAQLKSIFTATLDKYKFFQEHTLLHSKGDEIYYMSVFDNQYLAKYNCPSFINNISVDSINDIFMGSYESGFSIFDIRLANPTIKFTDFSINALGCISTNKLASIYDSGFYRLYDLRNPKTPLSYTFLENLEPSPSIEFTPNNENILLKSKFIYSVLDNIDGKCINKIILDKENDGAVTRYSSELVCICKGSLFSYRIKDGYKLNAYDLDDQRYKYIKTSPRESSQLALFSENTLSLFDY